jgi:hypothetical protein
MHSAYLPHPATRRGLVREITWCLRHRAIYSPAAIWWSLVTKLSALSIHGQSRVSRVSGCLSCWPLRSSCRCITGRQGQGSSDPGETVVPVRCLVRYMCFAQNRSYAAVHVTADCKGTPTAWTSGLTCTGCNLVTLCTQPRSLNELNVE